MNSDDPYPPHKAMNPGMYVVVKPLDEDAEQPSKVSDFSSLVNSMNSGEVALGDEDEPAAVLASKFGIRLANEIAVAESNSPQQIGDMSVAMSALKEWADEAAPDEPEPEQEREDEEEEDSAMLLQMSPGGNVGAGLSASGGGGD